MVWPNSPYPILSSITSLELRKIIFTTDTTYNWGIQPSIDRQLCELVDRLRVMGHRHTLEVEFRMMADGDGHGDCEFSKLLSEFRERGVVTIIDEGNGDRLLYSSACNH